MTKLTSVEQAASAVSARLLLESIRDYAIFALDIEGRVASWNIGAERTKGYLANEIIGKHVSVFYPPQERAAGKPQQLLDRAARDGRVEDIGWRVRKDGKWIWADVVITALRDERGQLVGYAKITRDLTDRRRAEEALRASEERFRLIVQSVKDYGIFMLDPEGIVRSWNVGAERIQGYGAPEIIGKHFSTFYTAEDKAAGKPAMELRIAKEAGRFEEEGWRVRMDGSLFWSSVVITPLLNDAGELIGYGKVTRDLTERRIAEQRELADARRVAQAEAANRAKTDFLAAMSHELRTPLNAIGGYTDLLELGVAGTVSTQQREYLERIRTAQQHLLALINDLLNYSRIEAGQISYDLQQVAVVEVVDRVLKLVEAQLLARGLHLERVPFGDDLVVLADRVKFEQIVLNLLSNAIKFTPPDGTITVACGLDSDAAFVSVMDTGPGIPIDKHEAVFEPFVQLGRSLTQVQEGTGLGLAISRDLARAMNGDLTLTTAPSGGAMFCLTFPRVQSP